MYRGILLFRGWFHAKQLPARCMFCVHHATMHQFAALMEAIIIIDMFICSFVLARLFLCFHLTGYRILNESTGYVKDAKMSPADFFFL